MHLHVCISPLIHMHAHTHRHQHTLTFCDMRNQTQLSRCSTLHELFIMFSLIELLMSNFFCFSTLFYSSLRNSVLLLMIHSGPPSHYKQWAHFYFIITDTHGQIKTPAQPWERMLGIWEKAGKITLQ